MTDKLLLSNATDILERVQARQVFHENREDALRTPHIARDRLKPYATLKISVLKAKELLADDPPWYNPFGSAKASGSSDPYAMVLVDDIEHGHTNTINKSVNPVWDEKVSKDCEMPIPIDTANSVVRVEVLDEDEISGDDLLGFVEFPVADLPIGNQVVEGWFDLTPKSRLQGTSKDRIDKALQGKDIDGAQVSGDSEHMKGKVGAVYISMKYEIVSMDPTDEFYAWCLPPPTFKVYPKKGFKRKHEPMDAQALYDGIQTLQVCLLDNMLRPFMAFFTYILTWREKWLTVVVILVASCAVLFPTAIPACWCLLQSLFLLLLKSSDRRAKMGADPHTAELNDDGFNVMAWMGNGEQMTEWLERVVGVMQGKVLNRKRLREFAAFSFDDTGVPVTTYKGLKEQLRKASAIEDTEKAFVEFPSTPLTADTLVADHNGNLGYIKECKNPQDKPEKWRYTACFGDGPKPETKDCLGDDLEVRLSLRWVANPVVLGLIPNGVEDIVNNLQPKVDNLARKVQSVAYKLHSILAWDGEVMNTLYLFLGLFFLSILFFLMNHFSDFIVLEIVIYVVKTIIVLVVIGIHLYGADFMVRHRNKVHADKDVSNHKDKDCAGKWPFFENK